MNDQARGDLEAILMVTDCPASATDLSIAIGLSARETEALLTQLRDEYAAQGRGFVLREVGGGWRYYSSEDHVEAVERFVRSGATAKLTTAALETLAIIAYRQPVSRGRIAGIRGVNVDTVVRTLMARGLIEEQGQDEQSGAVLFGTTQLFLERMGMTSLEELGPLAPHLPSGAELAEIQEGMR
jgi:segregation and condensation protein B